MRFHIIGLPHTLPTRAYDHDAFTSKIRKFDVMMRSLGHKTILHVSTAPLPPEDYLTFPYHADHPVWREQTQIAIDRIRETIQPHDFLCTIAGLCHRPIADAFPDHLMVEFGIGYPGSGTFAPFRVFESYAHQACTYGQLGITQGRFFDAVIPSYFDPDDFPFEARKDDYLLFMARLNEDKGLPIALEVAKRTGRRLVVCGVGTVPTDPCVDYRGLVGMEERGRLLSRARALLMPSLYLEPFGSVAVEAQFCGTPAITTDWGAYPETVKQGVSGFRCHYLGEFVDAVGRASDLDPQAIRTRAIRKYSLNQVRWQYQAYFQRLQQLQAHGGWYSLRLG